MLSLWWLSVIMGDDRVGLSRLINPDNSPKNIEGSSKGKTTDFESVNDWFESIPLKQFCINFSTTLFCIKVGAT